MGFTRSVRGFFAFLSLVALAGPGQFTDWIEQLAEEEITTGCGGGNYCPGSNNTRGQMAVFIVKTFNLQ